MSQPARPSTREHCYPVQQQSSHAARRSRLCPPSLGCESMTSPAIIPKGLAIMYSRRRRLPWWLQPYCCSPLLVCSLSKRCTRKLCVTAPAIRASRPVLPFGVASISLNAHHGPCHHPFRSYWSPHRQLLAVAILSSDLDGSCPRRHPVEASRCVVA